MRETIPTHELVSLHAKLTALSKRNMTASGIAIHLGHLGVNGTAIGEFHFRGERIPDLIPILLKSIEETLSIRLEHAKSDMFSIEKLLAEVRK